MSDIAPLPPPLRRPRAVAVPPGVRAAASRLLALADACLPATCIVCGSGEPTGLCRACERALPGADIERCTRCGIGVAQPGTCETCAAAPPAFARTVVLADYAAPLDRVVHALKFGRDASLAGPLGRALARRAGDALAAAGLAHARPPVVTAVPLATKRLAERGFNQSLEIARAFARRRSLEIAPRMLVRRNQSAPASTLHADERRRALHGAFEASARVDGCVVVVDDVMTTGATLEAAAAALLRAGAAFVVNCVVARTPAR